MGYCLCIVVPNPVHWKDFNINKTKKASWQTGIGRQIWKEEHLALLQAKAEVLRLFICLIDLQSPGAGHSSRTVSRPD